MAQEKITGKSHVFADSKEQLRSTGESASLAQTSWLLTLLIPLARPRIAGLVALAIYLLRAALHPNRLAESPFPYFNLLADAFLHGQLHLRLAPGQTVDLVRYGGEFYLYWPPFPALLVAPLVALFGVTVSDIVYTAVFAAITVALVAKLLAQLDELGIVPLAPERRCLLVATVAFGSVLFILGPQGNVWYTAQVIGWGCVLVACVGALTLRGRAAYCVAGLALACAFATRNDLVFNGIWLAYYLLDRDRRLPLRWRFSSSALGVLPGVIVGLLLGWYNVARFGSPLELGLRWHKMSDWFRADYERYGTFNLHYLPINLYYHFVALPLKTYQMGTGAGLFWMTPILVGAFWALWSDRRNRLVWALALSALLVYIPIGLVMGVGYAYGPRYLLDLMVPLIMLTALGIRRWRVDILRILLVISVMTYLLGSALLLLIEYS